MPLWDFHYTAGGLSAQEKKGLAEAITKMYTSVGMPAFYVQVRFEEMTPESHFVGAQDYSSLGLGEKHAAIQIFHVARTFTSEIQKRRFLYATDQILNPVFEKGGWDWEYWVTESPRDLWKVNGLVPPPTGSAAEKKWAEANRPIKGVSIESL